MRPNEQFPPSLVAELAEMRRRLLDLERRVAPRPPRVFDDLLDVEWLVEDPVSGPQDGDVPTWDADRGLLVPGSGGGGLVALLTAEASSDDWELSGTQSVGADAPTIETEAQGTGGPEVSNYVEIQTAAVYLVTFNVTGWSSNGDDAMRVTVVASDADGTVYDAEHSIVILNADGTLPYGLSIAAHWPLIEGDQIRVTVGLSSGVAEWTGQMGVDLRAPTPDTPPPGP